MSVKPSGEQGADEEVTVAALATEQTEMRKMLRALQKLTITHVRDCGALNKVTVSNNLATVAELGKLSASVQAIEHRFETFDKVSGFVAKHGKKVLALVFTAFISAWVSLLVQQYWNHEDTNKRTAAATASATAAANAVQKIPDETVQKITALHTP